MNLRHSIRIIFLFLLIFSPALLQAGDLDSRFNEANTAYSVGEYDKAIELYKGLLFQEGNASGILYNLANSYAQKGEVGRAILNYERALKLNPSDPDILGNLAKIRKDKGLFIEEPGKIKRVLTIFSINSWSLIALGCLLYMVFVCFIRFKFRSSSRSLRLSALCSLILLILSASATVYNYKMYNPMVVIANDVKLQISPFEGAKPTGAIEEGRLLFPVKQHENYIYVSDRTGRKGWIKSQSVEAVCM